MQSQALATHLAPGNSQVQAMLSDWANSLEA
jgi:hypothetical protein